MGEHYMEMGDFPKARDDLQRAGRKAPDAREIRDCDYGDGRCSRCLRRTRPVQAGA